jgi:hypothetical protein
VSKLPRTETLLVLACAAASAMLAASQFTNLFELTPPGGEALAAIEASDQHGYATLVLAVFSLVLLVVGIGARSESLAQVAAFAVAACGVVALLIFLAVDLPDVNNIGTLDDPNESFIDAKAEPAAGFWLELVGALVLTVAGGALATLGPEHIRILNRGAAGGGRRGSEGSAPSAPPRKSEPADSKRSGLFSWPSRRRS